MDLFKNFEKPKRFDHVPSNKLILHKLMTIAVVHICRFGYLSAESVDDFTRGDLGFEVAVVPAHLTDDTTVGRLAPAEDEDLQQSAVLQQEAEPSSGDVPAVCQF
ncbi:hypothetical protein JMJ77_0012213 [Colletotrichum scovillei]|uniref:Uncharacterized protein n=1 Tax=Colletotrichum scovillei TaxID=1209932 RepID=A0A9P7U8Q6_9PEZI|nr:hypothetical protein JMJ78_0001265 [Colletotrichum scovillei]KAG7041694.1 hypothetical protein JMJ77_0012213 [Colletotrichum scovillei]KAG7061722.1 hypothetical protein JMJ76_0003681 [Colletotrichum scovillei]